MKPLEAYVVRPWTTARTGSVRTSFGLYVSTSFPSAHEMEKDPGRMLLGLKSPCCGCNIRKDDDGYSCTEPKCGRAMPVGIQNHSLMDSHYVDPRPMDSHHYGVGEHFSLRPSMRGNCEVFIAAATDPLIAPVILNSFEDALGAFLHAAPWLNDRVSNKFPLPMVEIP